jgi:hypothetical protein
MSHHVFRCTDAHFRKTKARGWIRVSERACLHSSILAWREFVRYKTCLSLCTPSSCAHTLTPSCMMHVCLTNVLVHMQNAGDEAGKPSGPFQQ